MAEIQMGNLYDMNKELMKNAPTITREQYFNDYAEMLEDYFKPRILRLNAGWYHMLLCKEESDYTLFIITNDEYSEKTAVHELYECLANRGNILSIEEQKGMDSIEIWLSKENGVFAYYLFPYDTGVIKCNQEYFDIL